MKAPPGGLDHWVHAGITCGGGTGAILVLQFLHRFFCLAHSRKADHSSAFGLDLLRLAELLRMTPAADWPLNDWYY